MDLEKVYKKDGIGNTYVIKQTVHDGQIKQYNPDFTEPSYMISHMDAMESRESDIYLITYPKSGTHWLYDIISILLSGKPELTSVGFAERFMEVKTNWDRTEDQDPSLFITHLRPELMKKEILDKRKIVYVVRNPKSVATSYFSHRTRANVFEYDSTFAGFLPAFWGDMDSFCGTWFKHVVGYWKTLKDRSNAKIVFYEEALKDPVGTVQDLASFLGYSYSQEFCEQVVALTSIENTKKLEKKTTEEHQNEYWKNYWKKGHATGFVQSGKIDTWKKHFTKELDAEFEAFYEEQMKDCPDLKKRVVFE